MTSLPSWVGVGALGFVLLTTSGCGDAHSVPTSEAGAQDAGASDIVTMPEAGTDGDGDGGDSCVVVTGGGPGPWLDLQIVGHRFDAYEGRRIRIVVAASRDGRLGVADAVISGGAFELTIPGAFNYGFYTEVSLYVDDNANEACDAGEPLWGFVTGIVQANLLVEASPDGPCLSGGGPSMIQGCHPWHRPLGPCTINAQADLTMRLPCPL